MAKRRLAKKSNSVTDKWLEGTRKERKEEQECPSLFELLSMRLVRTTETQLPIQNGEQ